MKNMAESHEFRVLFAEHDRAAVNRPAAGTRSDPEAPRLTDLPDGEGAD